MFAKAAARAAKQALLCASCLNRFPSFAVSIGRNRDVRTRFDRPCRRIARFAFFAAAFQFAEIRLYVSRLSVGDCFRKGVPFRPAK